MRMISYSIAVFLLTSCASRDIQSVQTDGANFDDVRLLSVYDGDSFKVSIENTNPLFGENIGIRVFGIDCPERRSKNQCEKSKALEAKKLVENALKKASRIDLKNCIRGKYFRLVCKVYYDNNSLTDLLVKQNLGYPYFGKTKKKVNWCNEVRIPASKSQK